MYHIYKSALTLFVQSNIKQLGHTIHDAEKLAIYSAKLIQEKK